MNQPLPPFLQTTVRLYTWSILLGLIVVGSGTFIISCGKTEQPHRLPATIVTQPTNQFSRIGQVAQFTVTATGTAPLTYQWTENGTAIPGATETVYKTPSLVSANNGSIFAVKVSNAADTVSSDSATLTVGPRAPQEGDLRFQQVDAVSTSSGLSPNGVQSDINGSTSQNFASSIGTPLSIGTDCSASGDPLECSWFFTSFPLPAGVLGLTTTYQSSGIFGNLNFDLNTLSVPSTVITSLDLEPGNNTYAISSIQTNQAGGFSFTRYSILPIQLQSMASQLGGQSQVITAISFDNCGDVYFLAYAWQNDTTTIYEAKVVTATLDGISSAAIGLGADGYIVTALGGNPTNGFFLVGTRVQGDTMPRSILVITPTAPADLVPLFQSGYAVVGYLDNGSVIWIGEQ